MNIANIITAFCSFSFFMIGLDKFFFFLEPPCTLMGSIPSTVWTVLGVMQLAAGILIWLPRFRKHLTGFFFVFMIVFTIIHLINNTYDVGGAVSMAVLLGLLTWNPGFLKVKRSR